MMLSLASVPELQLFSQNTLIIFSILYMANKNLRRQNIL